MKGFRFIAIALLIVIMALATILETIKGSEWVLQNIYHNIAFMALWGIAFLLFLLYEIRSRNYRKKPFKLGLVIAFGLVLAGGLVTFLSGKSDTVHLRKHVTYDEANLSQFNFPFHITLSDFEIQYYQGTTTPANYESSLIIHARNQDIPIKVSVNHPITYKGYCFYQTSYDTDLNGTVLTVTHNLAGICIIYTGYLLIALLFIAKFIHRYWNLRRRAVAKLPVLLLLLLPQLLSAQKTVTREEGEALGKLAVYYRGRIAPLNTYAIDFTRKLTGKTAYKQFSAEQVLAGWLFYPEIWQHEPMIKVRSKEIRQRLNIEGRSTFGRFFTQDGVSKLPFLGLLPTDKGIMEVEEKIGIITQLHNGNSLTVFPQKNRWYAPVENLDEANPQDTVFITHILQLLYESVEQEQHVQTREIIEKMALFQQSRCEAGVISKTKINMEILLNTIPFTALFPILFILALLTFGYLVCTENVQRKLKFVPLAMRVCLLVIWIALTLFIALRTYISGHLPFGNGYETLLFLVWLVLCLTFFFGKKSNLLLFGGQLLAGFGLLTANLNALNPQISSLMPVLHSPWLTIHVSMMMIAYSLLAFISIIAIIYWGIRLFRKEQRAHLQPLTRLSHALLLPSVALLVLGIITGSVWANLTWGRCWGWDPKEVWALITTLVYGLALCRQDIAFLKKDRIYHIWMLIGFCMVLITYFGVNVWFSGLHSYN
ncbi:MAG: cytochrome c biogenesis protein CcsA [Bacteroidales bacterium]|jgi:cytochrome c-type biogenesis protein CcsB|nr:cytochrome c biogenesis protein CcsA [Bacteroidales bacterium]